MTSLLARGATYEEICSNFKWDIPEFAHLPIILGSDGKRLSKRHGAVGTQTYRDLGYLPDTLINYLALLGWNPGTEDEVFNFQFLMDNFSLEKINKKAAVFDNKKLKNSWGLTKSKLSLIHI